MAMDQAERDKRRREKAERLQEEDLRLKVRPGTKQALLELMEWAGIEEQGEAMTLMIHHIEALGHHALFRIARHEIDAHRAVARTEPLRLSARKRTGQHLRAICGWAYATYSQMIEALIHGIHALGRLHAAKFLTPPRHEISISPRLALAFDRKSMLMIQQDPGDEILTPA
ncbi:hypothetical protein CHR29_10065 [Pseudomonas monteilii]|uniref:hypothetical protein n=1 Tax=Pseudomonas TaxID=286 RepID=UPI000EF7465C|nr:MULTISPECIES: hypothetical protein [Pseudomonas]AYN15467.1 hypothetical protein CHR29_10065 [Pseudomonas monteilii]AYO00873.1 hypothetical protein D8767_18720 [Pseudomonas sp. LTGT-11-2Z]